MSLNVRHAVFPLFVDFFFQIPLSTLCGIHYKFDATKWGHLQTTLDIK